VFGDQVTDPPMKGVRGLSGLTFEEVKAKFKDKSIIAERRVYEIKGHGLGNRLFLVVPRKGVTTYRLVSVDKKDKGDLFINFGSDDKGIHPPEVLLLESVNPPEKK
jgi:hypothetical protein